MKFDNNGYARYEVGDVARVVDEPGDFHQSFWNKSIQKLAGCFVHIAGEGDDRDGYYYTVKESSHLIDIAFLKPANALEMSDDEPEDDFECATSCFSSGFKVM